ncbi:longitudinals lacking protein isoform X2 [Uranotaenia lowii]|uniref:longitudinals lacking protein isoform X2 n=1 Tax=Uranotaenia lowii TaxID=190385 RepID=UPI00247ABC72|nr:longitudinals lacking protein isoform X2 [Uranotaenia lowii]
MDDDQQFCLRWNNHQSTLISVFDTLLENGTLVDCTLAAEGKFLKAHKVVLSACSPYFAALLSQQYDKHPIFILKDVKFQELRAMMDYMYRGEVNISQDQLAALLKAAESLQIKGLSDNRGSTASAPSQQKQSEASATKTLPPPVPANKASGLTIENKRPLKPELLDSDVSGSREGSTSPTTSRKRKKIRRRSVDTSNLIDNHDQHSNSSSHSAQPQALALTSSSIAAGVAATTNAATSLPTSATTPPTVMTTSVAAIKKTDPVQQQQVAEALKLQLVKHQNQQQQQQTQQQTTDDEERSGAEQGDDQDDRDSDNDLDEPQPKRQAPGGTGSTESQDKPINQSELMIEPKNEYDDGHDENVEDLTLDEEELLDDLDQAGPSHGGEGSSQGYAQWQMEREQSEAFMAAQDAVGGQRDAQDILPLKATPKVSSIENVSLTQQHSRPTPVSILKVGANDVITTAGTAVIPVGATLVSNVGSSTLNSVSTISNQHQVISSKKILKPTHPRIKYSKHKNPSVQTVTALPILTIPTVTTSQQIGVPSQQETSAGTTTKIELLNFSLSRKFAGQGPKTIDVSNIQQIPISCISKPVTTTRYTVNEYETSTSNTSQSNDFTAGMIDDLDYSVIDDIELPEDVQVSFGDTYGSKPTHAEIEESSGVECHEQAVKASATKKMLKPEAKILNTTMDDKYALLANTSIMKNFEYTVNESVVSDNDENEMRQYVCRHCGKRYRWKSTLRRHENVECGGKEAMHQCPYCTYKAKQRGNLGVHIRKHHSDMPQLESRRKSKNRESLHMLDSIKPESMDSQG